MTKKMIFIGLALTAGTGGLAGLLYFKESKRKREMGIITEHMVDSPLVNPGHGTTVEPSKETKEVAKVIKSKVNMPLPERDKLELQDRIKAMSEYEWEAILEIIPVEMCMKRIQAELDHAREFESMIKKAYEMK